MAKYRIHHKTTYSYLYPVTTSHHSAHLKPLTNKVQTCQQFRLRIQPESADLIEREDYFGNTTHLFSIQEPHSALIVDANSKVETKAEAAELSNFDTPTSKIVETLADVTRTDLIDAKEFLYETEHSNISDDVLAFGDRFFKGDTPIGTALENILDAFKEEFEFDPEATDIYTPIQTTLATKRGVCQDFAHLMIGALRAKGLSACYASGYILTNPPPGTPRLIGADASHAWVSVFIPKHGWVDLDPTNQLACGDQHVSVAYGRDFSDVSMLNGAVTGGGKHSINVEVTMEPIE